MVTDQNKIKTKHLRSTSNSSRMGSDADTLVVIKLPDPKIIKLVSRSVFLALVFVTFPCIGSFVKGLNNSAETNAIGFDFEQFDLLLHGLSEEGLLRESHKALIIGPGAEIAAHNNNLKTLRAHQTVTAMDSASNEGPSLDETLDFVYASDLARDGEFVDRVLKTNGIIAFPLSEDEHEHVRTLVNYNYKIVYIRRFSSTMVAMRKIEAKRSIMERAAARRLLQSPLPFAEHNKGGALEELEEALLEPPRQRQQRQYCYYHSRRIKLLGEGPLEGFGRRVFVDVAVGQRRGAARWFDRNYPKMRQEFEVYDLNVVHEEGGATVSDWVRQNLREEEYVVMKAEAEVVEEMVNSKTIHLVDELFLECKNEWWRVGNKRSKSCRAYWECLALYGRVKDEGVAVHQWWG